MQVIRINEIFADYESSSNRDQLFQQKKDYIKLTNEIKTEVIPKTFQVYRCKCM